MRSEMIKENGHRQLDIFTAKDGKKHGLNAAVIGEGKKILENEPELFMLYRENKLFESGKSVEQLKDRIERRLAELH